MCKVIGLGNRYADNGPRCLKPPTGNKQRVDLYDDLWSWVLRQSTQWYWQRVNVRGYNQLSQDNVGVWMFCAEVHRKVSVTSHCQWTSVSYAANTFGSPRKPEASRRMAGKSFQRLAMIYIHVLTVVYATRNDRYTCYCCHLCDLQWSMYMLLLSSMRLPVIYVHVITLVYATRNDRYTCHCCHLCDLQWSIYMLLLSSMRLAMMQIDVSHVIWVEYML